MDLLPIYNCMALALTPNPGSRKVVTSASNSLDVEIHANVLVTSWGYKFNIFYICSAFDVTVIKYI